MKTAIVKSLSAAALAVCVLAGGASAQGKSHEEHGNGKGNEKRAEEQQQVQQQVVDPRRGNDPRRVVVNNGDDRRVPPGLAKKGGLPPGQARKRYRASEGVPAMREVFTRHGYTVVRTQPYGTKQYVYYRQANGPIQRAVIYPGSSQLGFQNVPQSLISEILSRLY